MARSEDSSKPFLAGSTRNQHLQSTAAALPLVLVVADVSYGATRQLVRGIARRLEESHAARTAFLPNPTAQGISQITREHRFAGAIAHVCDVEASELLLSLEISIVETSGSVPGHRTVVRADDIASGRLAAQLLYSRPYRAFAFCGRRAPWANERCEGFVETLRSKSRRVTQMRFDDGTCPAEIAAWLAAQPKPLGLLVCSDCVGMHALVAAAMLGLKVPEDVGIVGVDNDEMLCNICTPALSSVDTNHVTVGYEAMHTLERLLTGEPLAGLLLVAPTGVVERKSVLRQRADDPHVQLAFSIIDRYACAGINVDGVASRVALSKRSLQRRFQSALGMTLHDAIIERRMQAVCELLLHTSEPLKAISHACGFRHPEYLSSVFRAKFGCSPSAYRMRGCPPSSGAASAEPRLRAS